MKKDWEIKKLGDICELITKGTTPTSIGFNFQNKGINFVKIESFSEDGTIIENKVAHISKECHEALKRSQLQKGDILFSIAGALGRTAIIDESIMPANTNQALAIIRLQNKDVTFIRFLLYYFRTDFILKQIEKDKGGVAQQNLSLKQIGDFEIKIPPLEEQKRIVKILDEKFAQLETIKANAQTNLQNAKDLFQSQLTKAFSNTTWEKKRLGDFCESFEYGTSKKSSADGKVPVLRMGNIKNGKLDFTDLVYSNDEDEIKKYLLSKGDVLFNRTNSPEWVGKTAVFEEDFPAIFAGYIIRVNYDKKIINPYYLNYWLNSKETMEYGFSVMTSSVHQANISGTKLAEYKIPLPPLPEQKRIVKELDAISEKVRLLQEIYTKQIANCDELKQSLLQKAFEGKL